MYRTNKRVEKPLEPGRRRYALGFHRKKLTGEEPVRTVEAQEEK